MRRGDVETLTMAYAAGAISAMGRRPLDDNPFDPELDLRANREWTRGWRDHRRTSDVTVSNWWRGIIHLPDPELI